MQIKTFNIYDNNNMYVEDAYSVLRANILFSNNKDAIKSIAITSGSPSEGKTSIAINLAIHMAMSGMRVLLADTDFRKPKEAKRLNSEELRGLSDLIMGNATYYEVLCNTNIEKLSYISSGYRYKNPSGMITTPAFSKFLREGMLMYDMVILDTPALNSVIDGALVASQADGTIIVLEQGVTKKENLKNASDQLEKANANILGVVFNKTDKKEYTRRYKAFKYFNNFYIAKEK